MKKRISLILMVIMILVMIGTIGSNVLAIDVNEIYTVEVPVTYGQTEARKMLAMINEFRTGNEAWILNSDNQTKTTLKNLNNLEYDYKLEEFAMQRAAEIALNFSHTRPNGELCFTVINDRKGAMAENIAVGPKTATGAFNEWKEENENYDGQGHRRNMLSSYFQGIGIGHVTYMGYDFWVQEFSGTAKELTMVKASDGAFDIPVDISHSMKTAEFFTYPSSVSVQYGDEIDWPKMANVQIGFKDGIISQCNVIAPYTWAIADESYAKIVNGKIEGLKLGDTVLNSNIMWNNISIPLHVTRKNINAAKIKVNTEKYVYDGAAKKPNVIVTINDKILTEDDYALEYINNIEIGTGAVVVVGKENYTGRAYGYFEICCNHKNVAIDKAVEATCTKTGLTEGSHCLDCGDIVLAQKVVPVKAHTYKTISDKNNVIIKCTVCGNVKTKVAIPKKVTGLKVSSQAKDSIKFSWSKVTGAKGYEIYRYDDNKKKYVYVGKTTSTSYNVKKLKTATTYKFKVRAYTEVEKKQYNGEYSAVLKTTTKTATPKISGISAGKKKATIKWKKVSGASGYEIQMAEAKNGKYKTMATIKKGSTVKYTKSALKTGKKYFFKIRTYRIVDGKKIYSAYSAISYVKVK